MKGWLKAFYLRSMKKPIQAPNFPAIRNLISVIVHFRLTYHFYLIFLSSPWFLIVMISNLLEFIFPTKPTNQLYPTGIFLCLKFYLQLRMFWVQTALMQLHAAATWYCWQALVLSLRCGASTHFLWRRKSFTFAMQKLRLKCFILT